MGVDTGVVGRGLFSDREENKTADAAAPVAADMPATIAKVVFDMVTSLPGNRRREE